MHSQGLSSTTDGESMISCKRGIYAPARFTASPVRAAWALRAVAEFLACISTELSMRYARRVDMRCCWARAAARERPKAKAKDEALCCPRGPLEASRHRRPKDAVLSPSDAPGEVLATPRWANGGGTGRGGAPQLTQLAQRRKCQPVASHMSATRGPAPCRHHLRERRGGGDRVGRPLQRPCAAALSECAARREGAQRADGAKASLLFVARASARSAAARTTAPHNPRAETAPQAPAARARGGRWPGALPGAPAARRCQLATQRPSFLGGELCRSCPHRTCSATTEKLPANAV